MRLQPGMAYRQGRELMGRIGQAYGPRRFDGLWLLATSLVMIVLMRLMHGQMQVLDYFLLLGFTTLVTWSGWRWPALRYCYLAVLALTGLSILLYADGFVAAGENLLLNNGLSSHAAVRWMVGLGFLSWCLSLLSARMSRRVRAVLVDGLCWAALAVGLHGFFIRWYEGHLLGAETALAPLGNLYDVLVALVLLILLLHLYLNKFYPQGPWHSVVLFAAVSMGGLLLLLSLGYSLYFIEHRPAELGHALLRIHVPAMVLAHALFLPAGALALGFLRQHYGPGVATRPGGPSGKTIQVVLIRLWGLGFVTFSLGLLSGVLWSELAWGQAWLWEVKQTTSFAVWCYYAAGLHAVLRRREPGVLTAWWLVFGVLLLVFVLFWSNLSLAGHHYFGQLPLGR